jgi:hypothetical protein
MKRFLVLFLALSALLLPSSCEKKISDIVKQTAEATGLAGAAETGLVSDDKSGFVILAALPLWDIVEGQTKWKETLQIGEKLSLLGTSLKATQSGKERDFLQVRRDSGKEGWARTDYVIPKSMLAVITAEEVILYAQPKNTSPTGKALPRMTILAIHRDTAAEAFLRISAVDAEQILQKEVFIRNEGLSTSADDVQTAVLFQLAAQSKNAKQKEALLRSAVTDHPGSAFLAQVEEALAALTASSTRATERFFATLVASSDKVNVRSEPNESTGAVVGQLAAGQEVEAEEKTVESYTIGEQNASWYRIREPAGWVYGAFLKTVE